MSSSQFETFLARLYCDRGFLAEFMREPDRAIAEARLNEREGQAAMAIDRVGLLMAVRSFESKRNARTAQRSWRKRLYEFWVKRK